MWDQGSKGWDRGSEGWDVGPQPWDQESQTMGSGSAVSYKLYGSGIRLYHICGIRDENWARFWNQGTEICVQKWSQ